MRQRKATAYPHWGALVQPRPGDRYLPSARRCHENDPPTAPRQGFGLTQPRCPYSRTVPAPRTSVLTAAGSGHPSQRCRAVPAGSISTGQRRHGPLSHRRTLSSPSMIKRPVQRRVGYPTSITEVSVVVPSKEKVVARPKPAGMNTMAGVMIPEGTVRPLSSVEAETDGVGCLVTTGHDGDVSHLGEGPSWYLEDDLRVSPRLSGGNDRAELNCAKLSETGARKCHYRSDGSVPGRRTTDNCS
jgi:hypothetical protein